MNDSEGKPRSADTGTIEALKRIKAVEDEWDARLAEARREAEAARKRTSSETETAIATAREVTDAERARAVDAARATADAEARQIIADGEREAAAVARGAGKGVADRKEELLAVLLGRFATD